MNELTGFEAEVHRRLQALGAQQKRLDADVMVWLRHAVERRLHRALGMSGMVEYCERVLGYDHRNARERVRVAYALLELPKMDEAVASGALAYSAARELTRVATEQTEAEWLADAAGKPVREIEQAVAGRAVGDLPSSPREPRLAPEKLGGIMVTAEQKADILGFVDELEKELGTRIELGAALAIACQRGRMARRDGMPPRSPFMIGQCGSCGRGYCDVHGERIEMEPEAIERRLCDPKIVDGPGKKGLEIPAKTRRRVWLRDRGRCVVPGCRNHRWVEIHHLRSILEGGDHGMENLACLCDAHHDAFHRGLLKIFGAPSTGLRFEDAYGTELRMRDDPSVTRPDLHETETHVGLSHHHPPMASRRHFMTGVGPGRGTAAH